MIIEKDMPNAVLTQKANISDNIISKIKNGRYMALEKLKSICVVMGCTPNDISELLPDNTEEK